ncbi:MAG: hypothetical protein WCF84_10340 [Anaerolineae bacterium]
METSKAGHQCEAKNAQGKRCGGYTVGGGRFCFAHDPARAKDRAEARRRGGQARQSPKASEGLPAVKIAGISDVLTLVNATIADVWLLPNSPARGRVLLAAAAAALEALQIGQLEERVRALEARILAESAGEFSTLRN